MRLIELMQVWALSLREWLSTAGILLEIGESPSDRLNRSCWVNLRKDGQESELILWETGEAEFSCSSSEGSVIQEHYEFEQLSDLAPVLARLLSALG
jgi:hypothetical protein